jgi:hypothetical protein
MLLPGRGEVRYRDELRIRSVQRTPALDLRRDIFHFARPPIKTCPRWLTRGVCIRARKKAAPNVNRVAQLRLNDRVARLPGRAAP